MALRINLENYEIGEEIELNVTPEKEFSFDPVKGWGSYLVTYNQSDKIGINGNFSEPLIMGTEYNIKGEVSSYTNQSGVKRKQIKVHFCKKVFPLKKEGVKRFLKLIPGIGTKKAQLIFQTYGVESLMVLKNDPERVADEIPSISLRQAQKIQRHLELEFEGQEVVAELMGYEIHPKSAAYLFNKYKDEILPMIEENPYFLIGKAKDKQGRDFGFNRSEKIAQTIGFSPTSLHRIEAGVHHMMKQALTQRAFCYLELKELILQTQQFLSTHHSPLSYDLIAEVVSSLIENGELIYEESRLYLKKVYEEECAVAKKVVSLMSHGVAYTREDVEVVLDELLQDEPHVQLEAKQREAVIEANRLKSGLFILNGAAGTGKTFTLKWILKVKEALHQKEQRFAKKKRPLASIHLAPTGKAAKVMGRSLNKPTQTIHRGLKYNPVERQFDHDEYNPLEVDLLMCDETSMVDLSLAKSLFDAVLTGTFVIFLGDVNQLVSVGYGNVLRDLIASGVCSMVTLDVVKRQGLLSDILKNAYRIIDRLPILNYNETNDAYFIERRTPESVQATLISSIQRLLNRDEYALEDIQVLSPQRTGPLGTNMLNYLIQQTFNPTLDPLQQLAIEFEITSNYQTQLYALYFKTNDKVIHVKNNYEMKFYEKTAQNQYKEIENLQGITNGECGVIEEIVMEPDPENEEKEVPVVIVRYEEGYAKYFKADLNELLHAYCMTVHKSQGSGWKAVLCPISYLHLHMLDYHLIYTAWTRAMDFALFVGDYRTLEQGVQEDKELFRRSTLAQRIQLALSLNTNENKKKEED